MFKQEQLNSETVFLVSYNLKTILKVKPSSNQHNQTSIYIWNKTSFQPLFPDNDKAYRYEDECVFYLLISEYALNITQANMQQSSSGKKKCKFKPKTPKEFINHCLVFGKKFHHINRYRNMKDAGDILLNWKKQSRWLDNAIGIKTTKQYIILNTNNCYEEQPMEKIPATKKLSSKMVVCLVCGANCFFKKKKQDLFKQQQNLNNSRGRFNTKQNDVNIGKNVVI